MSTMTPQETLNSAGISLSNYGCGRHTSTCPHCSVLRQRHHQTIKCLSIRIEPDKAFWKCHNCGWKGPEKGSGNGKDAWPHYDYGDDLRKVKTPYENPRFIWQHQNGKDKWERGAGGADVASLLYRIDEAREAVSDGGVVLVVEGEKDANTCWRLGFAATCNSSGASQPDQKQKWTQTHADQLRGLDVVVCGDNDGPGRAHVDAVCRSLSGVATSVRLIDLVEEWPDIPDGGDISDWAAHVGAKAADQLQELIEEARHYQGAAGTAAGSARRTPEPPKPEPFIRIVPGQLPRMIDESQQALIKYGMEIFVRGDALVRPVTLPVPATCDRSVETVRLKVIAVDALLRWLAEAAAYRKYNLRAKAWMPHDPPRQLASSLLAVPEQSPFAPIGGVITSPTLRPDGSLLDQPGYDQATSLYLAMDPELHMPVLPAPTRDNALAALARLKGLLAEFEFATAADKSVELSLMVTLAARPAMPVAPLFHLRAHASGSGKTYLLRLAHAIVSGRAYCPVIATGETVEETEKRLGAILLEGAPVIALDNCSHDLEGDALCQITEQSRVRIRILGKSSSEMDNRATVITTGNNVGPRGDMVRRTLTCDQSPRVERPELRAFKHNPIATVLADRGSYLAACFTIIRAHQAAGSPKESCGPIASYEPWSAIARAPLIWLGEPDPLASMNAARDADDELHTIRQLFVLWEQHLHVGVAYTALEVIRIATGKKLPMIDGTTTLAEYLRPEFRDLLLQHANRRGEISSRALGAWLRKIEGRIIENKGRNIEMCVRPDESGNNRGSTYTLAEVRNEHANKEETA